MRGLTGRQRGGAMSIEIVSGRVEAVGQHILGGMSGIAYTFVRFKTHDGRLLTKQKVVADNELASYLEAGDDGAYAFVRHPRVEMLCGYAAADRLVVAQADSGPVNAVGAKRKMAWIFIALGLLFTPFLIGIPILILGVISLSQWPKVSLPSPQAVEDALRQAVARRTGADQAG